MPEQQPPHQARISSSSQTEVLLAPEEQDRWANMFGVAPDQISHDHLISHILVALSTHKDSFIFYGGTALSRTILPDLRLSEDIDLLSIGPRRDVAPLLDQAIRDYIEPRFGTVIADPWLAAAKTSTQACVFHIGGIDV